jgi:hypothetical protein
VKSGSPRHSVRSRAAANRPRTTAELSEGITCGSGDCGDEMSCARVWWNALRLRVQSDDGDGLELFLAGSASEARGKLR